MGDAFRDRAISCRNRLRGVREIGDKVDVPDERIFIGSGRLSACHSKQRPGNPGNASGFRPIHIRAAVAARKNIFTEKPVGVDGTGIRQVLAGL